MFRVLALVVAVHCTGALHAAIDIAATLSGTVHADEDCSRNEPSHDCPPGCPSCHCTNGFLSALPPNNRDMLVAVLPPPRHELSWTFLDRPSPPRRDPSSIYRPPRPPTLST